MKTKLATILALAAFLVLAVVGSATAALPFASVTETLLPVLGGTSEASQPSSTAVIPPAT